MKKQLFALLFALLIALPILAHAEAPLCQHYEISELQNMSIDQLQQLTANFTITHYSTDPSQNWTNSDDVNCTNELARVNNILDARINTLVAPVEAEAEDQTKQAEKAAYEETPEGKLFKQAQDTCHAIKGPGDIVDPNAPDGYRMGPFTGNADVPETAEGERGTCDTYIQYSLMGENCDPNSANTPEDIECMKRALRDVQIFAKAAQECIDNPPLAPNERDWGGLFTHQNKSLDDDLYCVPRGQDYIAVMEAKRAHWKALGYYPDN